MTTSYSSRLGNAPEEGVKAPVSVVATSNIALADVGQTISSTVITANMRVLAAAQDITTENGIYVALANQNWVRATDMNSRFDVISGQLIVNVEQGSVWQLTAPVPWFPGTNSLTFTEILSSSTLLANADATITGDWVFSGLLTIPEATVTAHQAALAITESQITDLDKYTQAEIATILSAYYTAAQVDALTWAADDIVSGTFADALIAASNVTQHQASLTISESQITDGSILARLAGSETITGAWSFIQEVFFGANGGGDSIISFYDDNSDVYRSIFWDDSLNTFVWEDNDGNFNEFGTGSGTGFLLIGA